MTDIWFFTSTSIYGIPRILLNFYSPGRQICSASVPFWRNNGSREQVESRIWRPAYLTDEYRLPAFRRHFNFPLSLCRNVGDSRMNLNQIWAQPIKTVDMSFKFLCTYSTILQMVVYSIDVLQGRAHHMSVFPVQAQCYCSSTKFLDLP